LEQGFHVDISSTQLQPSQVEEGPFVVAVLLGDTDFVLVVVVEGGGILVVAVVVVVVVVVGIVVGIVGIVVGIGLEVGIVVVGCGSQG